MKKYLYTLFFILTISLGSYAQNFSKVTGKVVSRTTRDGIENAKITLSGETSQIIYSEAGGNFSIENVPFGMYSLQIEVEPYFTVNMSVKVDEELKNINFITMTPATVANQIDDAAFSEFDTESSNDAQNSPIKLSASRDVFDQAASYEFSTMRFRNRGYDTSTQDTYFNGIKMNDALTGYSPWSLWSGLNDATRNQENFINLEPSSYGVGGINGVTSINATASDIRKGFRSSAVAANGSYRFRLMLSYASGNLDNGWSYAFSFSTRQGGNDFVKGIFYNSYAYFASVEKEINDKHRIALTFLGSPTIRGAQAAATQETYNLVGDNYYNPNWGYWSPDGTNKRSEIRNSRVRNNHEPIAVLNYIFTPNDKTRLELATSYRFGKNGYSALDWYDAPDPRPDYYRNLPSYYRLRGENEKAAQIEQDWINDKTGSISQLNWNKMYEVNGNSKDYWGNYQGIEMGAGRSKYILSERRTDQRDFNVNLTADYKINTYSKISAGASFRYNRTEYFNTVKDLLGGEYWVNIDNFAERDFKNQPFEFLMNDAGNTENLIVKQGGKYGYDYFANVRKGKLWANYDIALGDFSIFAAADGGYSDMFRDGVYKKGLFIEDSFGQSATKYFLEYSGKIGAEYKIGAHQTLGITGAYLSIAPDFQDAFISPRINNFYVPNLVNQNIYSGDLTYSAKFPFLNLRASAYYTYIQNKTKLQSYYDDNFSTFTNFAMSGINEQYLGFELGFQVPVVKWFNISGAVSLGNYIYASNPNYVQTRDNSAQILSQGEQVFIKDYNIEGTPQLATTLGFNFKTENYWFFGIDASYYDMLYLSMTPIWRTAEGTSGVVSKEDKVKMSAQEKLDPAFILSADVGKSWYINRKYNFGFSLQLKNLLNDTTIRTGGYEQTRAFTNTDSDAQTINKTRYESKYFYLNGITYYLNLYFRF